MPYVKGHATLLLSPLRLSLVALIAASLVAGCANRGAHANRAGGSGSPAPQAVPTSRASQAIVRPHIAIAGIIAPFANVAISNTLAEPADEVRVSEGDRVRRGQTLAVLDTRDLRAQLAAQLSTAASGNAKVEQARYGAQLQFAQNPNAVTQARATVVQAQQTLQQDELNLARDRQLLASGYVSSQQFDQQATTVNNDRAAVRSAQAAASSAATNQQVNGNSQQGLQAANVSSAVADAASARAAAEQIQTSIDKATIVSPVDGTVVNRNLNPGEYPNGRTLFTVQELSQVYAELNASSTQIFALRAGAPVALTIAGAGNRVYHGSVVAVLGQVEPGSTNFTVKVLVQNPDFSLQSGVPVSATIGLPVSRGVGIPATAFLDDTHSSVILARTGVARVAPVRELASDGRTSIVTGIPNGASVVTDGQLGLANGQKLSER